MQAQRAYPPCVLQSAAAVEPHPSRTEEGISIFQLGSPIIVPMAADLPRANMFLHLCRSSDISRVLRS